MTRKLARSFACPIELTLHVLAGKWTTLILCYLEHGPLRYKDLRRLIPRLSDKVLTARLADLCGRGLVEKKSIAGHSREVYLLAPSGKSLCITFTELYRWGEKHAAMLGVTADSTARRRRLV